MKTNQIILVDEADKPLGTEEKLKVHQEGRLHRAFSIFVINDKHELMLQRRVAHKYHSGGLWTNTCCSHAIAGEDMNETIHNRLREEMGFDCELEALFTFTYQARLNNGLTEYELDHVFLGKYNEPPYPNPEEVSEWKFMALDKLNSDIRQNGNQYTYWFKKAFLQFYIKYFIKIH